MSAQLSKFVSDTNVYWNVQPYGVAYGSDYSAYKAALQAQVQTMLNGDKASPTKSASTLMNEANKNTGSENDPEQTYYYHSPSVSDSSVGGNDAINPHSSFGLDDDIVHDVFTKKGQSWGMGRCYSELYDSKQQILYLTMGVPRYRNLTNWLKNATNKEMAELNETGKPSSWGKISNLISSGIKLAFELPWLPLMWSYKIINSIKDYPVTEYFMFRDTMPLYYRYVNSILSEIAVGMGLYGNGGAAGATSSGTNTSGTGSTDGVSGNGANMDPGMARQYQGNMPEVLKNGPDIIKIMCRRAERMGGGIKRSTDELLQKAKNPKGDPEKIGALKNFWTGIQNGALEGTNFIGLRIERSDQAGETFSNSTQESSIAAKLNGEVAASRSRNTGEANGQGLMAWARQKVSQGKALVDALGKLKAGDIESTIAYLAAGNGYFDLPKQWSGSAGMSRSLSFSMKLRARTGADNVSIFQSIMIPLSILLAAALPRAVGDSTYTSPFIIRAFCKGMFAIPAGIISSLSISRGASEFGWSISRLPTVVDVNFTIEDLSPMLFLSMAGTGGLSPFMQAFSNNTKMHEYINTLTGIGCKERYFRLNQLKRRLATAMLVSRNTTFSATYQGLVIGDSALVRSIMALTPWHRVKNN